MWAAVVDSPYWFELAVVFFLCAVGGIVFAPFARHEPRWRCLVKIPLGGAVAVVVSAWAGREWFFALLGAWAVVLAVIHGWWLPRHGVNGLTAEPRDRYFALRGWNVPPRLPGDRS